MARRCPEREIPRWDRHQQCPPDYEDSRARRKHAPIVNAREASNGESHAHHDVAQLTDDCVRHDAVDVVLARHAENYGDGSPAFRRAYQIAFVRAFRARLVDVTTPKPPKTFKRILAA